LLRAPTPMMVKALPQPTKLVDLMKHLYWPDTIFCSMEMQKK
jgi:hypothetical protein